jgi:hypothetical protein
MDAFDESVIGPARVGCGRGAALMRDRNPNDTSAPGDWHRGPLPAPRPRAMALQLPRWAPRASRERAGRALALVTNPSNHEAGLSLGAGLEGLDRRFVPYNGAVSAQQLAWARDEAGAAHAAGQAVVLLIHTPVLLFRTNRMRRVPCLGTDRTQQRPPGAPRLGGPRSTPVELRRGARALRRVPRRCRDRQRALARRRCAPSPAGPAPCPFQGSISRVSRGRGRPTSQQDRGVQATFSYVGAGRDETRPVSTGGRDETCPLSTGGRGGDMLAL